MNHPISEINLQELEEQKNKIQDLFDRVLPIIFFEPSQFKCKMMEKKLNDAGYFKVIFIGELSKIEDLIKTGAGFSLIILDGDLPDNESFKHYLGVKQKFKNVPKAVFLKDKIDLKLNEIYKKGGALGSIVKPFEVISLNNLIVESNSISKLEAKVDMVHLGDSYIIKLIGDLNSAHLAELKEKFKKIDIQPNYCFIIDASRLIKSSQSLESILLEIHELLEFNKVKFELFDPKNKLDKIENIISEKV